MQILYPEPLNGSNFEVRTVIDFRVGDRCMFTENIRLIHTVGYIRTSGSIQPHRAQGYSITSLECCLVELVNGEMYVARPAGVNAYLRLCDQPQMVELDPRRDEELVF